MIDRAKGRVEDVHERLRVFLASSATRGSLAELERSHSLWTAELAEAQAAVALQALETQRAHAHLVECRGRSAKADEIALESSRRLRVARSMEAAYGHYVSATSAGEKARSELPVATSEVATANAELLQASEARAAAAARASEAEALYERLLASQSELDRLLEKLKGHVGGPDCPACGAAHPSQDDLIRRIQTRRSEPSATFSAATAARAEAHAGLEDAESAHEQAKARHTAAAERLSVLEEKVASELAAHGELQKAMRALGLEPASVLTGQVQSHIEHAAKEAQARNEEAEHRRTEVRDAERAVEEAERLAEKAIKRVTTAVDTLKSMDEPMASFKSDLRRAEAVLGVEDAEDTFIEARLTQDQKACAEALAAMNEAQAARKDRLADMQAKLDKSTQELTAVEEEARNLALEQEAYLNAASRVIGLPEVDADSLSRASAELERQTNALGTAVSRLLIIEQAEEAASRSAVASQLNADLSKLESQRAAFVQRRERLLSAIAWLNGIRKHLGATRRSAVREHVASFGPLTTTIQARLHSVFGFGDISVAPFGEEVRVLVDRGGKSMTPTDYFSDSQKQVLMLSLYMAIRLTQTWSGFAPVLLDDPVAHFDDMNSFGFVEFIRGLASTSPGRRQFIVAVCEERLYDLMRQRFTSLGGGARFYRFTGIGTGGPTVSPE